MSKREAIEVAAGVIFKEQQVLLARKVEGKELAGLWEFPGGKIEHGETPELCLARELKEELNISIRDAKYWMENVHHYPNKSIKLIALVANFWKGEFQLTDHDRIAWVRKEALTKYCVAPADRPILEKLQKMNWSDVLDVQFGS